MQGTCCDALFVQAVAVCQKVAVHNYYRISWKFCWGNFDRATSFSATSTNNNIFRSFGWITLCINSSSDMWLWYIRKSTQYMCTYLRSTCTEEDVLSKQPQNSSPKRKRDAYRKRIMNTETIKCQLTSCEKNKNTECQSEYNKGMRPGVPVLRKLWHIKTTPFTKFIAKLRKWNKLTHVPRFPTSTVKPKSYGDKTQMSFVRKACVAFSHKIVEFPNSRYMYALRTYSLLCG